MRLKIDVSEHEDLRKSIENLRERVLRVQKKFLKLRSAAADPTDKVPSTGANSLESSFAETY